MRNAPLLAPAAAIVAAIAADAHDRVGFAILCALAIGLLFRRRRTALWILAGLLAAMLRGHPPMLQTESRTERFAVTVTGDVRRDEGGGATFDALVDRTPDVAPNARGLRVRVHLRAAHVLPGERLVVRGRLEPFDEPRNPGEPSRRAIALGEGLAGELIASRVLARAPPATGDVRTWGARLRARLSERLRRLVPEPEASVLAGALWGERGSLPRAVRDDFQATGTVHVLVTAGLHLGVIAALVLGVLRLARVPRIAASLSAIPCVVAYAWLSGAHLPSERAAVMVTLALVARACGARLVSWNALAAAALVVAVLWPASVTTVSFALSFSCVAAIGLFAAPLQRLLRRLDAPARVREALALTIATQVGVWPLSAATFGLVAPYAVVANAIVVPTTALAMVVAIATLVCSGVVEMLNGAVASIAHCCVASGAAAHSALQSGPLDAAVSRAAGLGASVDVVLVDLVLRAVSAVASLPGARVSVAAPSWQAIVVYDAVAVLAASLVRDTPRVAVLLLGAASAIVFATTLRPPDGSLRIVMLDVGQGDGIVIRTPRGHTILIDSGGRLERGADRAEQSPAEIVGERVVLAYLRREAIRRVDLLVNTHPHGDHVGGFAPIVRALPVLAVADSGQRYGGRAFADGMHEAAAHRVPVRIARCGDTWSTGDGVRLSVLSPCGALLADGKNDVNENSVVVMLTYRNFRMLFTGDAGFETERRLLARGADLRADVLKTGHHGSAYATSAQFLTAVRPRLALISAGRHNVFGHPAARTLDTLRQAGATVYRTDRCGALTLRVGTTTKLSTMLPCSLEPLPPRLVR
ncbi:MAG TPA: DNA internalization-related competence protein ComEC/Rec2 [Candidatus Baltobacteraceae bacterium]|nr:DNA internalization-related competence protein ComEC/Rec2 [Candidatus Baltobacteraceae bacterium]